jgi:hypothetical protein
VQGIDTGRAGLAREIALSSGHGQRQWMSMVFMCMTRPWL